MPEAVSNTSPLVNLHRIQAIEWLPRLFEGVSIPSAVVEELREGQRRGHDAPDPTAFNWMTIAEPRATPSEWLSSDLGPGELATMSLALEDPARIVLLDDLLARRMAHAAGLQVWGTLRVLLTAKDTGLTGRIEPYVSRLRDTGMWLSDEVRDRILALAGER